MNRLRIGCLMLAVSLLARADFRAGAAKVDVTPNGSKWLLGYGARQSTSVLDRIYHRILMMDDGKTQFVLATSDICLASPAEYDRVAAKVKSRFGLEPAQFWWSFTHTHSAPELGPAGLPAVFLGDRYKHDVDTAYTEEVEQKLLNGIAEARAALRPVRIGIGRAVSFANINRRARDLDGQTSLGMNPDGPVDRRVSVLRFDGADGAPVALVANYPIHGTVMGSQNLAISGDAPGLAAAYAEQKLGATTLFVNGAAGDVAPIYSVYPNARAGHLSQFRVLLGNRIVEAASSVSPVGDNPDLQPSAITVQTPRKDGIGWPDELSAYLKQTGNGRPLIQLPVRALRIGRDTVIWSAPIELFCEVAMGIRERSPFANTLYFGYTNGWLGYMPTEKEWPYGGYEPSVSPYTPRAEHDLAAAVLEQLNRLRP
ncbi:MAG: neutral/alkaline non-lysosomal ceramidase N-terminal domain-containing protein [Bryobacterales bacterium]|nr:neutral/alkaline non-lysosomal ceramidase N-terminal domain-containing protein [Bryobacterales bacterium]